MRVTSHAPAASCAYGGCARWSKRTRRHRRRVSSRAGRRLAAGRRHSALRYGIALEESMTAPAPRSLMSAEELLALPDSGRSELVGGALVPMTPAGGRHGILTVRIGRLLDEYVEAHQLGVCCGAETGFILRRGPDTVRAPDAAVVVRSRIPADGSRRRTGPVRRTWRSRSSPRGIGRARSGRGSTTTSPPVRGWSGSSSPTPPRFACTGPRRTSR